MFFAAPGWLVCAQCCGIILQRKRISVEGWTSGSGCQGIYNWFIVWSVSNPIIRFDGNRLLAPVTCIARWLAMRCGRGEVGVVATRLNVEPVNLLLNFYRLEYSEATDMTWRDIEINFICSEEGTPSYIMLIDGLTGLGWMVDWPDRNTMQKCELERDCRTKKNSIWTQSSQQQWIRSDRFWQRASDCIAWMHGGRSETTRATNATIAAAGSVAAFGMSDINIQFQSEARWKVAQKKGQIVIRDVELKGAEYLNLIGNIEYAVRVKCVFD